jgi:hypothetical protein
MIDSRIFCFVGVYVCVHGVLDCEVQMICDESRDGENERPAQSTMVTAVYQL